MQQVAGPRLDLGHARVVGLGPLGDRRPGRRVGVRDRGLRGEGPVPARSRRPTPSPSASGPAFALARSERELWVASGRSARLELDAERGKLAAAWTLGEAGPALAPPQVAGDLLVLTQQSTERAGRRPLGRRAAVRARSAGGPSWAPPGPSALADAPGGDALTTLAEDGRVADARAATGSTPGGFVEVALPQARRVPAPRRARSAGSRATA